MHRWIMEELSRIKRRALGVAMAEQLAMFGVGVCSTRFGRLLGGAIFEFRVDEDVAAILDRSNPPSEPICFRLFCHAYGKKRILILAGYDKGEDPTPKRQQREIRLARSRLKDWLARRTKDSK